MRFVNRGNRSRVKGKTQGKATGFASYLQRVKSKKTQSKKEEGKKVNPKKTASSATGTPIPKGTGTRPEY